MKGLWWMVAVVWMVSGGMGLQAQEPGSFSAPKLKVKAGEKAPDFALRDRDGNLVRLSDYLKGKYGPKKNVLLDFFATDCKACKEELPQVVDYQNKNASEIQVVMISLLEQEDGLPKLEDFLNSHPLPFPVLVDAYESVAKKYVVDGETVTLPALILIDDKGVIQATFVGLKKNLELSLQEALTAKTAGP